MAKKMLIDATHAEETRVVVVDGNKVEEFDFESENKRQLAGNIYLAKVTRVEPSLQAAFVDYGGNRHGFLAFSEIHPDYYQIPVADREALMAEERAYAEAQKAEEEEEEKKPRRRSRSRSKAEATKSKDATAVKEVEKTEADKAEIAGMETIDLDDDQVPEGSSPMETVAETPVEEPVDDAQDTPAAAGEGAEAETAEALVAVAEPATPADESPAEEAEKASAGGEDKGDEEAAVEDKEDDNGTEDESEEETALDAAAKDETIESVAEEDDSEDIRPRRKPRPRRYKIQEVIKVRQILLVQVVKEERGNKGAALTTYLSLAGRYCVLMPNTARGGGISRKITNAADRKKLKDIATGLDVPQGAGLIVRTAGAKRTKSEIKRDYEYLQRLWEQIRELTLKSIAPAKIYEEGDLIKRSIRDLYSRDIDEVLVEGERGYRIAKDFMKMIMPSHAKNVKQYADPMPLFARFQVESYLSSMFNPTVQLRSGGYIVIGVTEALVAIDVNSGRATKEGSIEETALKTNLEAAEEVARQLRLRDLAGLIVIDFIDMDERRNNNAVEKRMKDALKSDRARIQVGRISGFGLMEMSRQRLRPGMIEATTQPCPSCHGTGLIRSDDNLALSILRQIEEEGVRRRSREVLVKCPISVANFIMNQKREHVAQIEARYGLSVRVEGDVHLISPDFTLEKFKTATRVVAEPETPVVSVDTSLMDNIDEEAEAEAASEAAAAQPETGEEEAKPKKRRRRRRRRKSNGDQNGEQQEQEAVSEDHGAQAEPQAESAGEAEAQAEPEGEAEAKPDVTEGAEGAEEQKPKRRRSRSRRKKKTDEAETGAEAAEQEEAAKPEAAEAVPVTKTEAKAPTEAPAAEPAPEEATEEMAPEEAAEESVAEEKTAEPVEAEAVAEEPAVPEAQAEAEAEESAEPETVPESATEPAKQPEPVGAEEPAPKAEDKPAKPKKRGWWSLG
ncbi:Rne/Rng family ribonuclease [Thalassovita aquimarina]|uniref:Ribonuclease E n=1 Tax=Thalassovita aquimarina TaxID=2785917 RepID=A0ABS5HL54_9RHOB|nr:Rne/Rng family ribonuclease [Thalassovita aquimarina]MBR9649701.1 Rne/Rng family ribonuclease [Thalassovita aquimarina]